jgi:membrane associated rhomboid family serine protease
MTLFLVVITAAISILALSNHVLMRNMIFNPYQIQHQNQWYRFITSGLIHADWMHLFINMFVLYSFGRAVEYYYEIVFPVNSKYYFMLLYFGGMLISVAPSYAKHKNDPGYNALGASGAVSAVTFAAIVFDPLNKIYLWGFIGLPGILLGVAYLGYSWYMGKKGGDNVNHDAHFWGAVFGALFTFGLKPSLVLHFFNALINFNGTTE